MSEKQNDVKHSPTPWSLKLDEYPKFTDVPIVDANGDPVVQTDAGCYPPNNQTAAYIVEAVNAHERLVKELGDANEYIEHLKDQLKHYERLVAALQRCERWFAGVTSLFDREHVGAEMRVPAISAFYELDKIRAALGEEARNG